VGGSLPQYAYRMQDAVSANDTCSSMLSAKVPVPRMAGLKGEAGVSPALSRNCKDAGPSQVARLG